MKVVRMAMRLTFLFLSLWIAGVGPATGATESFGYLYDNSGTVTSYAIAGDRRIPVRFSASSDARALAALRALKWQVLVPNADGRAIVIEGELGTERRMTPAGPNRLESAPYYDFRLTGWTIGTPFTYREWKNGTPMPGEPMVDTKRTHLEASDFEDFAGKAEMDFRSLERAR